MQPSKDTLRLLILDTSQNDAEDLINLLRNAGQATQAQMIESEAQLSELLNSKTWDMCFANDRVTELTPPQALTVINKLELDIPMILLSENYSSDTHLAALEAGIRDAVPAGAHKQLLLVAMRELDNLYQRRARRKAEIGLREAEKRCRLLLDSSQDAIAYVHDGMHIYANSAYIKLFGYADFDELEGMPLMDMVASKDQEELKSFLRNYRDDEGDGTEFSCQGRRDDDTEFDAKLVFSAAKYDGEPCTQIVIYTNQAASSTHAAQAKQDFITGLLDQSSFYDSIEKAISQASDNAVKAVMLYVQLDDFIPAKNRLGAANTNLVLGDIAKILSQQISAPNQVARIDEFNFGVLLMDADANQAQKTGKQLCEAIAAGESNILGEKFTLTASIGISIISENSSQAADIVGKARDAASFIKRDTGEGNSVHLHSTADQDAAQSKQVETLLETALEKQLFRLLFQPIVSLRGDSGEHYEALLRMPDEEGNNISPAEFLQAATSQGIINQIDRWVIEEAVSKLKGHLEQGNKTHLLINLSAQTYQDTSLLSWLGNLLNEARLPGDSLIFQISETEATSHLSEAKEFVKGINKLQCKAALTHFGRSLNPFNTLKHLPVSYVKIDSSFVTELSKGDDSKDELKTLVSSLHTQGKLTIAPLVDTASLLSVLWQAGINYIQGYYIQQPSEKMDYDFSTEDDED